MYKYYFENLITHEVFCIEEDNPSKMKDMIRKAKYSEKISYLGSVKK